jgi:hypothetical protein
VVVREVFDKPFVLVNKKTNNKIEVSNATNADCLMNELEVTHYKYDKSNDSVFESIAKYAIANEVVTAVEVTESMLKNGSFLYAYGRLDKLSDNVYVISKPFDSNFSYILTRQNRLVLLDSMRSSHKGFKIFAVIIGGIGLVTGLICLISIISKIRASRSEQKKINF